MAGLAHLLSRWRGRRVALVGIGNLDLGDDGAGVRLAEALAVRLAPPLVEVIQAGTAPEHVLPRLRAGAFEHVVFLDAVDFGGAPGEAALAGSAAMATQHPQLSTHRLSLGLLARVLEDGGRTRAWLLGIQPAELRPGGALSHAVQATVDALAEEVAGGLATHGPAADAGGGPP